MTHFTHIFRMSRRQCLRVMSLILTGIMSGIRTAARAITLAYDFLSGRIATIYQRDTLMPYRKSQDNPGVTELYAQFLGEPLGTVSEHLLHTSYHDRSGATAVSEDLVADTPATFPVISAIFPNPFNSVAQISYTLPESSRTGIVIYNMAGQKVRDIHTGFMRAGAHRVTWDGRSNGGQMVSSGVYIARLSAGRQVSTKAMTFMK